MVSQIGPSVERQIHSRGLLREGKKDFVGGRALLSGQISHIRLEKTTYSGNYDYPIVWGEVRPVNHIGAVVWTAQGPQENSRGRHHQNDSGRRAQRAYSFFHYSARASPI
ncbi:MAG: hypothetical protein ACYS8I_13180 [Planctomycetota bacterium]